MKKTLNSTVNKDVFGSYLLEGAEFDIDSNWDIPFVDTPLDLELPNSLIPYSLSKKCNNRENAYLHFFEDDYIFDGRFGIWNALKYKSFHKKGFNFERIDGFLAIITPDYSMYCDMPIIMQMWNLLRNRIIGCYLMSIGYKVVVNVRWTDENSYDYCFAGLRKNSIVAVSTLGCLRSKADKQMFLAGLKELIIRIRPRTIILYGSLTNEIVNIFNSLNQDYLFFPSQISKVFGGEK